MATATHTNMITGIYADGDDRRLGSWTALLRQGVEKKIRYWGMVRELRGLSQAQLEDIGLPSWMIEPAARKAVYGA